MAASTQPGMYTAPFADWRCAEIHKLGLGGTPMRLLAGGWNQESDYLRYRFGAGDRIVLVSIDKGLVYVIGAMTVVEKATRDDWLLRHPEDAPQIGAGQVVVGRDGLDIRFDRALPLSLVGRLTFQSGKVERPLKGVQKGLLKWNGFQGVYRVSPHSAGEIADVIERGVFSPGVLGELERRLQQSPADIALADIYTDALLQAGDPRGEALLYERRGDASALRNHVTQHLAALIGVPGGFPFRLAWAPARTLRAK